MKTVYKVLISLLGWIGVGLVWYLSSFFIGEGRNDAIALWFIFTDMILFIGEICLVGYFLGEIRID